MQKINIHIPEPCNENWDAMEANTQGRFCGSCQKTVVDFTQQSDYDIAQFLGKPENAGTCGRFTVEQLGTTYNYYEARKSPNFLRQAAGFAGLLLLVQPMTGCFMGPPSGPSEFELEMEREREDSIQNAASKHFNINKDTNKNTVQHESDETKYKFGEFKKLKNWIAFSFLK